MTQTSNPQPNDSPVPPSTNVHSAPHGGYTRVHNAVFDQFMPTLSGNGLKILLVALRQTWGWKDDRSPTGRKRTDQISYSQFMEKAGLSRATVARAIKECLDAGVLLRVKNGCGHNYAVKPHFEPTGSDDEPSADDESLSDSGIEPPPGNGPTAGSEGEPLTGEGPQIRSESEPSTRKESAGASGIEPPPGNGPTAGSKDGPSTGEGPLTGPETEPPSSSEPEHTKQKRKASSGGESTNHILSLLKGFGLSVDQEVRDLAAQYSLPQIEYGVHRATQQARSNPQGLLRTWMRSGNMPLPPSGHMPFPPAKEQLHEKDSGPYHKLNDDAQAFRHHQAAKRAERA